MVKEMEMCCEMVKEMEVDKRYKGNKRGINVRKSQLEVKQNHKKTSAWGVYVQVYFGKMRKYGLDW